MCVCDVCAGCVAGCVMCECGVCVICVWCVCTWVSACVCVCVCMPPDILEKGSFCCEVVVMVVFQGNSRY